MASVSSKRFVLHNGRGLGRFFLALSLLISASLCLARPAALNLEDELIVELRLGDYPSQEPVFIYRSPEFTLIPLEALASALDLPVQVDMDALMVQGQNIDSDKRFSASLSERELYIDGRRSPWPDHLLYAEDGFDIYLDQQSLQAWFGLEMAVDVGQLQLNIEPDPAIPMVARIAREAARKELKQRSKTDVPEGYIPNTYVWLGKPQFDFSAGFEARRNRGDIDHAYRTYLQGRGDVLKHSLHGSYIDSDGESDLRLTFSRASAGPDQDIALGFDRYQAGDLFGLSDNLVFSSAQGRGLVISRGRGSALEQGDTVTLEGDAPPGWEVELYRNGSLLEFGRISQDGRYLFENIPVFVGENIFDIRLYGPQGQFREERETVTTGGNMLSKGAWQYEAWAMRKNDRLIDSGINRNAPESDLYMAEARYGFNHYLSGRFGAAQMKPEGRDETQQYGFTNLYASAFGATAQMAYAMSDEGGEAYQLSLQSRIAETNINLDASLYDQLVSDRNPDGSLETEYKLRLDRSFSVGLPNSLQNSLSLNRQASQDGDVLLRAGYRASSGWAGFQATNNIEYIDRDGDRSNTDGLFSVTRKWQGWRYKGGIEYELDPTSRLSALSMGVSGDLAENVVYTGSLSQRFKGQDVFSADNTISWRLEHFSLSASAGFNSHGFQYLGFSISSSLGYDAHTNNHFFTADSKVNNASVRARIFIDEDADELYDEGETLVSGVRFEGQSKWRKQSSDSEGQVTLNGLKSLEIEKLELDEKSIEDPFLQVSGGPRYIYTHAGSHRQIDIALVQTFEIEGLLLEQRPVRQAEGDMSQIERQKPVPGARIELHNDQGLVDSVRSEFDGVYIFTGVVPGAYCIIVKNRLEESVEKQCFESDGLDGVVFVEDIILSKK